VAAIVGACELSAFGQQEIGVEDIASDWRRASFDLAEDAVGVESANGLVAHAEVFAGWRAEANVHPEWRGRGIGAWLLRWTEQRAAEGGSMRVGQTVADADTSAVGLLRGHAYGPLYTAWVLRIRHDAPPSPPQLPEGVGIRDLVPGEDERAVFRLIDDAFGEWANRAPSTFGDWAAKTLDWKGFEPWQLPAAVAGDEIVGAAHLIDYGTEGWVGQLAVRRDRRGRGIATALLHHAFGVFYDRGQHACGLSTDSRTGALGLYERVGMRVARSYTHYAKELP
jgi:GNAT superfamily N-acetyltransferase